MANQLYILIQGKKYWSRIGIGSPKCAVHIAGGGVRVVDYVSTRRLSFVLLTVLLVVVVVVVVVIVVSATIPPTMIISWNSNVTEQ
mmetsp:Transcript_30602/g.33004  ORF Transcript_30602/g.33004 Transcript_30602/m.33004 type:complete len:86 (+) Transcript_30602:1143-1400(+)